MPRVVVKRSRAELIRKVETGKAELARPSPFPSESSSRGTQKKKPEKRSEIGRFERFYLQRHSRKALYALKPGQ
ncbi:MAG: hypothetical protein WBX00_15220 [Isosphaeraceae bacterium]